MDRLLKLFKNSQPWKVTLSAGVAEAAFAAILESDFDHVKKRDLITRVERLVSEIQKNPLKVLGHPPRQSEDKNAFRYAADSSLSVSAVADLNLERKELVLVGIYIKGLKGES